MTIPKLIFANEGVQGRQHFGTPFVTPNEQLPLVLQPSWILPVEQRCFIQLEVQRLSQGIAEFHVNGIPSEKRPNVLGSVLARILSHDKTVTEQKYAEHERFFAESHLSSTLPDLK